MRPLKRASGSFYNIYIYTTSLLLFDISPLYIFSGVQGCYSNFASLFSKVYRLQTRQTSTAVTDARIITNREEDLLKDR